MLFLAAVERRPLSSWQVHEPPAHWWDGVLPFDSDPGLLQPAHTNKAITAGQSSISDFKLREALEPAITAVAMRCDAM